MWDQAKSDPIARAYGRDYGIYQLLISFLIYLSKFPSGFLLSSIFLSPHIAYKCVEPEGVNDACAKDCKKVEYDQSIFNTTITSEWNLICDDKNAPILEQALVFSGVIVGSIYWGIYCDKKGRRKAFCHSCSIQLPIGLLATVVEKFWLFLFFRFWLGFVTAGQMTAGFLLLLELVGPKYRASVAILYQIPFNLGHASLAVVSYYTRDWRWYHFYLSIISVIYIMYYFTIPESARWLLGNGRVEETIAELERGARWNRTSRARINRIRFDIELYYRRFQYANVKKPGLRDLFYSRNIRKKMILIGIDWVAICMVTFGVALYIAEMDGDLFMHVLIGASAGIPGTIACVKMCKIMGRRDTLIYSELLSGISLVIYGLIPPACEIAKVAFTSLSLFGAAITFPNVYLFTGELFPTSMRGIALGASCSVGFIGAAMAPFVTVATNYNLHLAPVIFGCFSLFGAICSFFLPETKDLPLPNTIQDSEQM